MCYSPVQPGFARRIGWLVFWLFGCYTLFRTTLIVVSLVLSVFDLFIFFILKGRNMKFVIAIFILTLLFIVIACAVAKVETISLEFQGMEIVRSSIRAYNVGDWPSFAELHSPGYLHHAPDYEEPIAWPEYALSCRVAHNWLPQLQYRIEDIFAVVDKVAYRCVWECRDDSYQFKCHYPDGVARGSLITISRIKNGKIVEEWIEYDPGCVNNLIRLAKAMQHNK